MTGAQSIEKTLLCKFREFECLLRLLLRRHLPKYLHILPMIRTALELHKSWQFYHVVCRPASLQSIRGRPLSVSLRRDFAWLDLASSAPEDVGVGDVDAASLEVFV